MAKAPLVRDQPFFLQPAQMFPERREVYAGFSTSTLRVRRSFLPQLCLHRFLNGVEQRAEVAGVVRDLPNKSIADPPVGLLRLPPQLEKNRDGGRDATSHQNFSGAQTAMPRRRAQACPKPP